MDTLGLLRPVYQSASASATTRVALKGGILVARYVAEFEQLVSPARLDRYRPTSRDDLDTVVTYLWNVSLSEALLQCISAVEIGLRNSIHTVCTAYAGTDQWFWAVLHANDRKIIDDHWTKLATKLRRPPSSGKVIADLTLGFWPQLFDHRYKDFWWDNGEAQLKAVFPHLPTGAPPHLKVGRKDVFQALNLFRELRNRAMHHEPIFMGIARPDFGTPPPIVLLPDIHAQIVDMLGWINPLLARSLSIVDRFPDVYVNGKAEIEARFKTAVINLYGAL
jgi:hypothetical protein